MSTCGRNTKGQLGIDPNLCLTNSQGHKYIPEFADKVSSRYCF